jgi:hypothetical protein
METEDKDHFKKQTNNPQITKRHALTVLRAHTSYSFLSTM